jgi:diguanylate cyclase (GGDEF)-like protein/PAS domain S-box-containing protein
MTVKENGFDNVSNDVANLSPYFICIHKDSIILSIDEGGTQLLGFEDPVELTGKSIFSLLHDEEKKTAASRIAIIEMGTALPGSTMKFLINGVQMDLDVKSERILFQDEPAIKSTLRFITPLNKDLNHHHLTAPLFLNSNKGIIVTRPDGIILSVSESFTRLTGFLPQDVIGNNPRMWKSRSYTSTFYEKMWSSILTNGCWQGELWNKRRDGSHYLMKVNIYSVLNGEGQLANYIAIYTDLTEVEKLAQQLKEREEQYRTLVELSPNAILLTQNKRIVYANPPAADLFGMDHPNKLTDRQVDPFFAYLADIEEKIKLDGKSEFTFEHQFVKNGLMLDIEVSSSFITYQGQEAVLTVIKEITERKKMERELRESEEQYRFIAENSSDMIGRLSRDGEIVYISPACRRILGFKNEELLGTNLFQKFHPEDMDSLIGEFGNPKDFSGIVTLSYRMLNKNGDYIWAETVIRSVKDKSGNLTGMMFATRDITARRTIEIQLRESNLLLRRISSLDGLTEIYNRRAFDEFLQSEGTFACRHNTPISLLMLDIDYFKKYNDTYGHILGDECLKTVARKLEDFFHEKGHYAARYGGEEFAVVLPNTDSLKAYQLAEEFRNIIHSMQIENPNSKVSDYVTISIGLSSLFPKDDHEVKHLLHHADRSLYQAKKNGRNRTEICTQ